MSPIRRTTTAGETEGYLPCLVICIVVEWCGRTLRKERKRRSLFFAVGIFRGHVAADEKTFVWLVCMYFYNITSVREAILKRTENQTRQQTVTTISN